MHLIHRNRFSLFGSCLAKTRSAAVPLPQRGRLGMAAPERISEKAGCARHSLLRRSTVKLEKGYFDAAAESIAKELAALIKSALPDYLMGEWFFANSLAGLPMVDALVEALIERGLLTPPADGIGAEGCWMEIAR